MPGQGGGDLSNLMILHGLIDNPDADPALAGLRQELESLGSVVRGTLPAAGTRPVSAEIMAYALSRTAMRTMKLRLGPATPIGIDPAGKAPELEVCPFSGCGRWRTKT